MGQSHLLLLRKASSDRRHRGRSLDLVGGEVRLLRRGVGANHPSSSPSRDLPSSEQRASVAELWMIQTSATSPRELPSALARLLVRSTTLLLHRV
jgi:hypothetical protein